MNERESLKVGDDVMYLKAGPHLGKVFKVVEIDGPLLVLELNGEKLSLGGADAACARKVYVGPQHTVRLPQ